MAEKGSPSQRQLKVSNIIINELIKVIARGKKIDIRLIENKVTFTKVTISPDLRIANCYFLPFVGSKMSREDYMEAFELSKFSIRKQITESVNLKYSPEIRFFYDSGASNAIDVDVALKNIK